MKVGKRPLMPDNKRRRRGGRYIFILYIVRERERRRGGLTDFEVVLKECF